MDEPIFIVGMYKCGTSWLLSCLNAHPELVGLKELDLVKCLAAPGGGEPGLRRREERLANVFGGTAWCRLTKDQIREAAGDGSPGDGGGIYRLDAEQAVPLIAALHARNPDDPLPSFNVFESVAGRLVFGRAPDPLLTMQDISPGKQVRLYETVASAMTLDGALESFVRELQDEVSGGRRLVLKGADQIAAFDILHAWKPDAPRIAIIRDGRDAAISAMHFRRLMRRRSYAWVDEAARMDLESLLGGWKERAGRVLKEWRAGRLYVLRYEDLTLNWHRTLSALLDHLGVGNSWYTRARIHHFTNFRAVTGRKRGEAAESIRRRGSIREWREALSAEEAARCWEAAGEELAAFGYSGSGALLPLGS